MLARKAFSLVFVIALIFSAYAKASPAVAQTLAAWDGPNVIWNDGNYPANLSMSNDGSVVVALLPNSGTDQYTRSIAVAHRVGDAWGAPQVIATNGRHSGASFQPLPSDTRPAISGDGQTIVYLGYASDLSTNSAFIIRRQSDNTWSTPQNVTPTLPNVHDLMSLNYDGTVLAVSDFPFFGTQQLYVLSRSGDVWSEPVQVTPTSPDPLTGGGNPSLSASGNDLVYIHNARLTYLSRSGSTWSYPQELTDNTWEQY